MLLFLAHLALAAPVSPPPRAEVVLGGARSTSLDLWRASPGADKVYVLAGLPDGSEALFLLDTGASISVINRSVVERLGLPITAVDGRIEGLSGSVPWNRAILPKITLGDFQLNGVDVAVDVPGVPELAGALPVAGILGNNVWTNFVCVLDYPADVLELHVPGDMRLPRRAAPLEVDNLHAYTPVGVKAADGTKATVVLELDTGAHDVMFRGATGEPFRGSSTEGVEPVIGIGANLDDVPIANFLRVTRRVPLAKVKIGGRTLRASGPARWYDADTPEAGRGGLPGLLGYAPLSGWKAILDFPGGRFQLVRSRRAARSFDAAGSYLAKEIARYGDDPHHAVIRARLQYAMGDVDTARATVHAGLAALPGDTELEVLLSWIQRNAQEWDASLATLDDAEPAGLAEAGEWVAYIDSLLLAGQPERALAESTAALAAATPGAEGRDELLVALSDALLAGKKEEQASAAIDEAAEISAGGSAHLIRKARVALAVGDRYGAMVSLRELIRLYPLNGAPMWLYASLVGRNDAQSVETLKADIHNALARLHPGDEPWDFVGAALREVGDDAPARDALAKGYARDCTPIPEGPDRANCDAWYWALGGERLDEAQARIAYAVKERPWASAFHDTAGVVARVVGKSDEARAEASLAARLSPGDPYLLWQVDRVDATLPTTP
jgi:tetratricopeptide (TPR) repeat protein